MSPAAVAEVQENAVIAVHSGASVTDSPYDVEEQPDEFELFRDHYFKSRKAHGKLSNKLNLGTRLYRMPTPTRKHGGPPNAADKDGD